MSIFSNSDKSGAGENYIDPDALGLIDINREFKTHLGIEDTLFNRFSKEEVAELLTDSGMFEMLAFRGFDKTNLEIQGISEVDNRIYIKTPNNAVLVHMRLKFSDFLFKKVGEAFPMVYIDWLLSQNVRLGKLKEKKRLFEGQEYPGLNVMNEITSFIRLLASKIGAAGAFNIPEYFHDAVLFHKNFRFLNPEKEGEFRALLRSFRKENLRSLSGAIHSGEIMDDIASNVYKWSYGEMVSCINTYLEKSLFDEEYDSTVAKISKSKAFSRIKK
ncbi:hypothetical protein LEP1GSC058_1259 [Leptospira fainei serovar Hurstbridge str. BUT 6]|uniref:Uncharacterized protein n=1 Tax=Leptospira fainei serovar Hurstbridge str. BUT 6 TaxID=1193011 RepID=S3VIE8_9LEPT|nr:hypothetical protein [Leptospira fainei]EPG76255.1 hypothetical protein LEP1GSC058_1259 [Leptospira fainei serovar Hurstbridge str. BUT 6]